MYYEGFLAWDKSKERVSLEEKYKLRFVRKDNVAKAISKGYKKIEPAVVMSSEGLSLMGIAKKKESKPESKPKKKSGRRK